MIHIRRDDGETAWRAEARKLSAAPEADVLCGMSREPSEGGGVVACGTTTGDAEVRCTGGRPDRPAHRRTDLAALLPNAPAPGVRTAFVANRVLATWGEHSLASAGVFEELRTSTRCAAP